VPHFNPFLPTKVKLSDVKNNGIYSQSAHIGRFCPNRSGTRPPPPDASLMSKHAKYETEAESVDRALQVLVNLGM
jgi:hypothetical protein